MSNKNHDTNFNFIYHVIIILSRFQFTIFIILEKIDRSQNIHLISLDSTRDSVLV